MKIYLDDIRATPEGWHRCFKVEEVQKLLCDALLGGEPITNMSLDHDLGASYLCQNCVCEGNEKPDYYSSTGACECSCHLLTIPLIIPTGYDLIKWMAKHDMWPVYKPTVHSANPVGRVNMQAIIDRYWHPPEER
jgi:hypothetical protein